MRTALAIAALALAAISATGSEPDRYDATLFAIVVPHGRVTRAGPEAWWISAPTGGPAWSASRAGAAYTFTRPDRTRMTATPNGRGGWSLREWSAPTPTDASRDAAGGLTVRGPSGSSRTATAGGRVVRDTPADRWADVFDIDRGQYRR